MPDLKEMHVEIEEGLRQQAEARQAANGPTRPVRRLRYQTGSLINPTAWNEALATLPPPCHAIAYCLLNRRWRGRSHKRGGTEIGLGNIALDRVGITKHTKMPALKLLEDAGLITIG